MIAAARRASDSTAIGTPARQCRRVSGGWRSARLLFLVVSACFLLVNLVICSRSPTVWPDEVMFADPAVNVLMGHGFVSSAWPEQTRDELFAGNSPAYSYLLVPWLRLFGFHLTAVRSLNYVLMVAAALVLAFAATRLGMVRSRRGVLLFVLLFYTGYTVCFSYRAGRYDILGILLCALIIASSTLPRLTVRYLSLLILGAFLPWVGMQLIPYTATIALILLLLFQKRFLTEALTVGAGVLLGSVCFAGYMSAHGVLSHFLASFITLSNTTRGLGPRLVEIRRGLLMDYSALLLLVPLMLVLLGQRGASSDARLAAIAGLLLAFVVPLGLGLCGRYWLYYGWMVFVPLSLCAVRVYEILRSDRPWLAQVCLAGIVAAMFGLPARLALTCHEWSVRDYAPVRAFVGQHVKRSDRVLCDFTAYYPAKLLAGELFLCGPYYIAKMSQQDRRNLTLLVLDPSWEKFALTQIGGTWKRIDQMSADGTFNGRGLRPHRAKLYRLAVYRRSETRLAQRKPIP